MKLRVKKKHLYNGATLLITLFVMFIFFEIALGIAYPYNINKYQKQAFPVEFDQTLGWKPVASETYELIRGHQKKVYTFNSKGLRDTKEIPYKKGEKKRIVVLGDSFMMGEGLDDKDLYSKYLQDALTAGGHAEWEVVNLGVSGYGTDQALLYLMAEGLKYEPDIVVLGYFQNDMMNNMWATLNNDPDRGKKPVFQLQEDGSLQLVPVGQRNPPLPPKDYRFLYNFHTYLFFDEKVKLTLQRIQGEDTTQPQRKENFWAAYHDSEYTQAKQYSEGHEFAFLLLTRLLDQFVAQGEENNFDFFLLNIPTNTQTDPFIRQQYFGKYDVNMGDFAVNSFNQRMQAYVDSRNQIITYLDLLPLFVDEGNVGEKWNIFHQPNTDFHWSPIGARRSAQETVKRMEETGLLA